MNETTQKTEQNDAMRKALSDWKRNETQTDAKLEINRIVWQYGRPNMTLLEAEQLAVEFWSKLMHHDDTP